MGRRSNNRLTIRPSQAREVPGRHYDTPKELWGFHLPAVAGDPTQVARDALAANAPRLGLDGITRTLKRRRTIRSLGGWHIIFSQEHLGTYVHRAYVTVHMDDARSVYLMKNRAVPRDHLPAKRPTGLSRERAIETARAAIRRTRVPIRVADIHAVWYPVRTQLHLSYKVRLLRRTPAEEWIVFVDIATGKVWSKYDNLAQAPRATVFNPNPVVALGDWRPLLNAAGAPVRRPPAAAYTPVTLGGLPRGAVRLDGTRASTAPTKDRLRRAGQDFSCASHEHGFEEVMAYHHVDSAIAYVERLGYRGERRIFDKPLEIDARATDEDNSFYSPSRKQLWFGTGKVDDAEDGETILHEFGHALQDAICPDFGQSAEAAAMGEGFGDYMAASFFAERKIGPLRNALLPAVMTWDGIIYPDDDEHRPPCLRRVDGNTTYESFDHAPSADEHENGEIWSATLWDIWTALTREIADPIIIESHFQLDGFTSFAKGARAIVDADRQLFHGRHRTALTKIFAKRGIGPVV